MKKNRYSLKKLKVGLVSVVLVFAFFSATQVQASEQGNAPSISDIVVVEDDAIGEEVESVIQEGPVGEALSEILEVEETPIVDEDEAVEGDVVDSEISIDDASEFEDDGYYASELQVSVTTKTVVSNDYPEGELEPIVTTKSSEKTLETEEGRLLVRQTVVKTSTGEIVKEVRDYETSTGADIVFMIDHTGSMVDKIAAVKQHITSFVEELYKYSITPRLGLVDYAGEDYIHYARFDDSHFTSEPVAFLAALSAIKASGVSEEGTASLSHVALSSDYDWSEDGKRFVILVTGEEFDYSSEDISSLEETIALLKEADISTSVISLNSLADYFLPLVTETDGVFLDVTSDFSTLLTGDLVNWIVALSETETTYLITEDVYEMLVELILEADIQDKVSPMVKGSQMAGMLPLAMIKDSLKEQALSPKERSSNSKILPNTGDMDNTFLSLLGGGLWLSAFVAAYTKARKID
ncbi:VWA domain-containing protein [Streptococcus sp. zg-JUN1979]|uniref:VWA domain-containing protein n=1 Tax=Streptococcus sp. zg-JUN1979 TaxID=3391450 RepID=UPI0039A6B4BB